MKFASDRFIARQHRNHYWVGAQILWTSVTTDVRVVAVGLGVVYVLVGDKATLVTWRRAPNGGGHGSAITAGIRLAKRREAAIERFVYLAPTRQGTP